MPIDDSAVTPSAEPAASPAPAAPAAASKPTKEFKGAPSAMSLKDVQKDWDRIGDRLTKAESGDDGDDVEPAKPAAKVDAKAKDKPAPKAKPAPVAAKPTPKPAPVAAKPTPKPAPKPAPVAAEADEGDADQPAPVDPHKAFAEQAAKLGFKVVGDKVTPKERYGFREEQRRAREAIERQRQEIQAEYQRKQAELEPVAKKYSAFQEALEASDFDAAAVAAGYKDWNDLQNVALERLQDPSYKRVREIEARLKAKEEAEAKAQEARREYEAKVQRQQAEVNYKRNIAEQARKAPVPLLQAIADDPLAVETIFAIQKKHYDPNLDTTISLEDALDEELPNGKTLKQVMREQYERLQKVFGVLQSELDADNASAPATDEVAESAPAVPAPAGKKPVTTKQPVSVPRKQTREAASKGKESDREMIDRYVRNWATG